MIRLALLRIAGALPNLIGVIVITFLLTRALPGDPAAYFAGQSASSEAVEQIRAKLGLDRPMPEQFLGYLRDLAQGNLGESLSTGQSVATEIASRLPASLELTLVALLLLGPDVIFGFTAAMVLGIIVGTYSSIFVSSSLLISLGVKTRAAPVESKAEVEMLATGYGVMVCSCDPGVDADIVTVASITPVG